MLVNVTTLYVLVSIPYQIWSMFYIRFLRNGMEHVLCSFESVSYSTDYVTHVKSYTFRVIYGLTQFFFCVSHSKEIICLIVVDAFRKLTAHIRIGTQVHFKC